MSTQLELEFTAVDESSIAVFLRRVPGSRLNISREHDSGVWWVGVGDRDGMNVQARGASMTEALRRAVDYLTDDGLAALMRDAV